MASPRSVAVDLPTAVLTRACSAPRRNARRETKNSRARFDPNAACPDRVGRARSLTVKSEWVTLDTDCRQAIGTADRDGLGQSSHSDQARH